MADQCFATPKRRVGGDLLAEGSLADARLAYRHDERALSRRGGVEAASELLELVLPTDERPPVEGVVSRSRVVASKGGGRSVGTDLERRERSVHLPDGFWPSRRILLEEAENELG